MNSRNKLFPVLLTLLLCLTLVHQRAADAEVLPVNGIVALVNEDVILASELRREMQKVVTELRREGGVLPPLPVLRRQVLERLILRQIQLQKARETGIRVDDETLNRAIASIASRNGFSLAQFRKVLEDDGFEFSAFREEIREQMTLSRLRQRQVNNRIVITEQEVDDYLANLRASGNDQTRYRLAHILIAVPEGAAPERIIAARNKATELVKELRAGADFRQLAIANSDGQKALEGGELGWRSRGQIPTLFAKQIVAMKPGEVSDPIRSASGFHIIKLMDRQAGEKRLVTQTHARHILLKPDADTTPAEVLRTITDLRTRILQGESFEDLARANSADQGSAIRGGDLGWTNPGDFVEPFEKAMNALAPGEISEPFETQYGWHIVQVLERRQHDSTEEIERSKAKEALRKRRIEEETALWLRRLRDEAYVEYRIDQL
jgi:peptidyl-prolyl cis-trans isomerase SurA